MGLITRAGKGSELSIEEMDGNLTYLAGTLSGSIQITGSIISDINSTGNITAVSMSGDGSGLTSIPASGITGLNLSQIASGSATASISPNGGLQINTGVGITGSLILNKNFGSMISRNTAGGSSIVTGFESFADNQSLAVGGNVSASGGNTVAFGQLTRAQALASVAQGYNTVVESNPIPPNSPIQAAYAHAEGWEASASAFAAHAEGYQTQAGSVNYNLPPTAFGPDVGRFSHAEGWQTKAFGESSHAEGYQTQAGYVKLFSPIFSGVGDFSHAEGIGTIASGSGQHAQGKYNTHGNDTSLMIIGNGTDDLNRSDLALFNTNGIVFNQPLTASVVSGSFVGDGSGLTDLAAGSNGEIQFNNNGELFSDSAFTYKEGLGDFLVGDGFGNNTISASMISRRLTIGDADSAMDGYKIDILNLITVGSKTPGIYLEGPVSFDSPITASGNISSSGTIIANKIESSNLVSHLGDANTGIAFGNDTVVIETNDINMAIFSTSGQTIGNAGYTTTVLGSSLTVTPPITASGNISSSADIYGTTGSFGTMVLTAPNGTKYSFSTNNSGHLQLTGSIVP